MNFPYQWQPSILPTQVVRIGNVVITAVPGEFTTMAGRRMKDTIRGAVAAGIPNAHVVLAGLSNAYSSYVTTFEEYQIQRYEGASTIFGPYTLDAYLQLYEILAQKLVLGKKVNPGPDPPNLLSKQISLRPGVVYDGAPMGKSFGDVVVEPDDVYALGSNVTTTFIAGHPRNNLMTESSFLTIERLNDQTQQWDVVAVDGSLDTKFVWRRTNSLLGQSQATVIWEMPDDAKTGLYRVTHSGSYKTLFQQIKSYSGKSKPFKVVPQL